ncbi:putative pseudouridylate synthase (nucleomorph) [Guillardia theta]|uniref:Pseudouridylate synthase n=1 Tax=Guillardia theta TaxID=55529 RepID=Q98SB1_GUITH|nr:putative pseudouridylate synthase [Guillardia theta]AAK39672.1 putative pseudouridylate synthase [Guillardia theta]|mmetsp:Transcript_20214/g.67523  ORF Transcript_20214/g.67523 Transcript_20214/m.67523 type:complete len:311 (+) Transcript_20214:8704-9636(+)
MKNVMLIVIDKPIGLNSIELIKILNSKFPSYAIFNINYLNTNTSGCVIYSIFDYSNKFKEILNEILKEFIIFINLKIFCYNLLIKKIISFSLLKNNTMIRNSIKFLRVINKIFLSLIEIQTIDRFIIFIISSYNNLCYNSIFQVIKTIFGNNLNYLEYRQVKIGSISEDNFSITFYEFLDILSIHFFYKNTKVVENVIISLESIYRFLKKVIIKKSCINTIYYGSRIYVPGIIKISKSLKSGDKIKILDIDMNFIGIGKLYFTHKSKNFVKLQIIPSIVTSDKNSIKYTWKFGKKSIFRNLIFKTKTFEI